jgi:hypothetical protein
MAEKNFKSRAERNKDLRRDSLREELKSREYIRQVHRILDKQHTEAIEIQESRMKMDGYFKLLAKTLPDVKSVEITGNEGGPIQFTDLDDEQLKRAIEILAAEAGISLSSDGTE